MKHFRFRLQAVLEQRERRETQAKQTYAEAQAALTRAERLLVEMREVRQALLDELCRRRAKPLPAGHSMRLKRRCTRITCRSSPSRCKSRKAMSRRLRPTCEAHKLHLIGTSQDRQALATVHDRHQAAHAQAALRAEQAVMDELATTRFHISSGLKAQQIKPHPSLFLPKGEGWGEVLRKHQLWQTKSGQSPPASAKSSSASAPSASRPLPSVARGAPAFEKTLAAATGSDDGRRRSRHEHDPARHVGLPRPRRHSAPALPLVPCPSRPSDVNVVPIARPRRATIKR